MAVHFMTEAYVYAIERGFRTIETVPEFDPRSSSLPVRKWVVAAIAVRKVKARLLTFAEVCGKEGTTERPDDYYGIAKDDKELQSFIVEYAKEKSIKL